MGPVFSTHEIDLHNVKKTFEVHSSWDAPGYGIDVRVEFSFRISGKCHPYLITIPRGRSMNPYPFKR